MFRMILKKNEVPAEDLTPAIQKLSHEVVRLLCYDLPQSGIQFSPLDGSAKLVDVARHLRSSEEAIITSASSDEEGSIVIFQQISQEGSEVRIRACGGHGFPVYSLPGLEFSEKYRETMDFLEKNLVFKMVLKKDKVLRGDASPSIQKLSHKIVRLLRWDLPLSGIHFSSLDGSAKLVDVARHLRSSEEAIVTAASSDEKVRVLIFQLISQEGSEVR